MAKFRLETVFDSTLGLFAAELYYPDDATEPFVKTSPMFRTHEAAATHVIKAMKEALPDQPIKASK
jgi:hypothetical protein